MNNKEIRKYLKTTILIANEYYVYKYIIKKGLWKKEISLMLKLEKSNYKRILNILKKQKNRILKQLKKTDLNKNIQKNINWANEKKYLYDDFLNIYIDTADTTSKHIYHKLTGDKNFTISDTKAVKWLEELSKNRANVLNEFTNTRLNKILANGLKEGWSQTKITNTISDKIFNDKTLKSRARRIAQTETLIASNWSKHQSAKATGLILEKTWLTSMDEIVRPSHQVLNGKTVLMDEDFVTGNGNKCKYPGDISLPANDLINCRCDYTISKVPVEKEYLSVKTPYNKVEHFLKTQYNIKQITGHSETMKNYKNEIKIVNQDFIRAIEELKQLGFNVDNLINSIEIHKFKIDDTLLSAGYKKIIYKDILKTIQNSWYNARQYAHRKNEELEKGFKNILVNYSPKYNLIHEIGHNLLYKISKKKLKFEKIFSKLDKEMIKTNISLRAADNYRECFAESIVLYSIDKSKLPKSILNFIENEVL